MLETVIIGGGQAGRYQGDEPDGFIVRDEVARFVEGYAAFIGLRCGTTRG